MILSERDFLNVKGKQFQGVHSNRICSPNESLISVSHNPSLPQIKLQAQNVLAQSIHKDLSGAPPFSQIHLKPLICKNKSCIYLVRNLEDKIAKYIVKIKEIGKENNILRQKLQMDRSFIDNLVPSINRSEQFSQLKQLTEEVQYPRSNFNSLHDAHLIRKFSNEVYHTNLTQKRTFDIFNNLNMLFKQPFSDISWNKPTVMNNQQVQSNKCLKSCQNNAQTDFIELNCNHTYHKNCLCEEVVNSPKVLSSFCQCNQKLSKHDMNQLNEVQRAIIKEIKLTSQLSQLIKKSDKFAFYKCQQSSCPFIIIDLDYENILSVQSFCQSCLNMRLFYKKEQMEK
ncbi:unnamed protein product [Paramecium primaurelia]|uniref:Uncharacterized protein n=1 Tax=Paramecium primaurelia TaxID=5886 RepID=A0A8S1K422_PARPR|nr:unnamed protein product [Paramecium primaurelia]